MCAPNLIHFPVFHLKCLLVDPMPMLKDCEYDLLCSSSKRTVNGFLSTFIFTFYLNLGFGIVFNKLNSQILCYICELVYVLEYQSERQLCQKYSVSL